MMDYAEVERVVEEHGRWVVVEKLGAGSEFAVEHDPRARSGSGLTVRYAADVARADSNAAFG